MTKAKRQPTIFSWHKPNDAPIREIVKEVWMRANEGDESCKSFIIDVSSETDPSDTVRGCIIASSYDDAVISIRKVHMKTIKENMMNPECEDLLKGVPKVVKELSS